MDGGREGDKSDETFNTFTLYIYMYLIMATVIQGCDCCGMSLQLSGEHDL